MEWVDLGVRQEDCTAPSPIFLEVFNCISFKEFLVK